MEKKADFSQRHPILFGVLLLTAATALIISALAAFRFWVLDDAKPMLGGERLGIARVEEVIMQSERLTDWLSTLRDDDTVKGVLLRVDSPGGSVGPSQEIFQAVKDLAAVKPVVVSMGAVAASGGYYVACPAHVIVANPGTITGSIGVKMELANYMGLAEKIGVDFTTIASGKFKDTGNPFDELTEDERNLLTSVVMDLYDQFVGHVAESRKLPDEKVRQVADGRILTGRQALEEGLVDKLGSMETAMDTLKAMANVPDDVRITDGPKEPDEFFKNFFQSLLPLDPAEKLRGRWMRFSY